MYLLRRFPNRGVHKSRRRDGVSDSYSVTVVEGAVSVGNCQSDLRAIFQALHDSNNIN